MFRLFFETKVKENRIAHVIFKLLGLFLLPKSVVNTSKYIPCLNEVCSV